LVSVAHLQHSVTLMMRRQLRAHKNLCADVIRNDFDLTKNKFSYKALKERAAKVPKIFGDSASNAPNTMRGVWIFGVIWRVWRTNLRLMASRADWFLSL